jgi:hypothetical protein
MKRAFAIALCAAACATTPPKPKLTIEVARPRLADQPYMVFISNHSDEPVIVSSIRIGGTSKQFAEAVQPNTRKQFDVSLTDASNANTLHVDVDFFTDGGRFTDSCSCPVGYARE